MKIGADEQLSAAAWTLPLNVATLFMAIEFDPAKRDLTLHHRKLDFARCDEVFDACNFMVADDRADYGEDRFITVGRLDGVMVVVVWTPRGETRRIISLRKANDRERARYQNLLD